MSKHTYLCMPSLRLVVETSQDKTSNHLTRTATNLNEIIIGVSDLSTGKVTCLAAALNSLNQAGDVPTLDLECTGMILHQNVRPKLQ